MRDPATDTDVRSATLGLFVQTWPVGKEAVFTDTNGNVIAGTGKLASLSSVSGTSWFENAQSGRTSFTFISNTSELTRAFFSAPALATSAPVRDARNQIFGYVICFSDISDITRAVESVLVLQTGRGFLVTDTGVLVSGLLFTRTPSRKKSDTESRRDLLDQMSKGQPGSETVSYAGKQYLLAWTPITLSGQPSPELGWSVGVAVSTQEAYRPAQRLALALTLLAIILLICGAIASILLARSITSPINELVRGAEKVGSGDLTGQITVRTKDQIGTLATAFLRMRDYLRTAVTEAGYTADKMSALADEQSAGTHDFFEDTEEIGDSVVVLAKNMETQTQKIRKVIDQWEMMPDRVKSQDTARETRELLQESEILAEVGTAKAVEIASATQDQRGAARDVAAAARRLSGMASELKEMVQRFKV